MMGIYIVFVIRLFCFIIVAYDCISQQRFAYF